MRPDAEYFEDIGEQKVSSEMLGIAQEIISRMAGHFEPASFTDRYEEAVTAMLQAKQAGHTFTVSEPAEPANVVDIMEALKRSLAQSADGALRRPRAPSRSPPRRRRPLQESPRRAEATAR